MQILLGHAKIESTVRYRGVDVENALILAERTDIRPSGSRVMATSAASTVWSRWPR